LFGATFFHGEKYALILTKKRDWATFYATFSQTRPVAL
jgi:hypothetical protein